MKASRRLVLRNTVLAVFLLGISIAVPTIAVSAMVTGCSTAGSSVETGGLVEDTLNIPLQNTYVGYFPIGAAVAAGEYGYNSLTSYSSAVLGEFNSLVAENCMKPGVIHPTEATYNWAPADSIIAYAKANNMKVRGHVLVWHNQTGSWMFGSGTQAEKKAFSQAKLLAHINAVTAHFKGDVYCWDVVNEAIKDNWSPAAWTTVYREDSPWYTAYGDASYIQDAFDYASAADPAAKLFYNDYNVCDSSKRARIVKMINDLDLKSHGLDGIGIQGHWTLSWPSIADIQATIDIFHDMGLDVQITELDIDCYNNSSSTAKIPYATVEKALAARYQAIFDCFRANKDKISGVTLWGIGDDHTWLDTFFGGSTHAAPRKNYPLLFDAEGNKKQAYLSVRDF